MVRKLCATTALLRRKSSGFLRKQSCYLFKVPQPHSSLKARSDAHRLSQNSVFAPTAARYRLHVRSRIHFVDTTHLYRVG